MDRSTQERGRTVAAARPHGRHEEVAHAHHFPFYRPHLLLRPGGGRRQWSPSRAPSLRPPLAAGRREPTCRGHTFTGEVFSSREEGEAVIERCNVAMFSKGSA